MWLYQLPTCMRMPCMKNSRRAAHVLGLAGISQYPHDICEKKCCDWSSPRTPHPPAPIVLFTALSQRGAPDPQSLLVISHPDALKAGGAKGTKSRNAAAAGRNGKAYLPEMLFLCILRQKLSWPVDLAVGGGAGAQKGGKGSPEKQKPVKRRRV